MSWLFMFSISVFMIFSIANGATEKSAPTAVAVTCGANETWNPCPPYCYYDEYCPKLIYGFIKDCPRPPPDWKCTGTCVCKPGFVRENGLCLSPTDACCTFPNTEFVQCNASICPKEKCVVYSTSPCKQNGCQCKAGFEYAYGVCVALPKCSDPNEEVVNCPNPCPGGTCTQPNFTSCSITTCKPYGCQCKKGYVKDKDKKCIPLSECPEPCGKNETWNPCPPYCYYDEYCPKLIYGYYKDCNPPPRDWRCTGTCVCKPGLVRENGLCLTPTDACCPIPNTEFVECNRNNTNCPREKCVVKSINPCKQNGCQCKAGFIYTNGTCTAVPPAPCGVNEVWNPCPPYCYFDEYCPKLIYGFIKDCPPPPPGWKCTGTCVCKPGFVRENGICSTPTEACCTVPNTEFVKCNVSICPKEKCVVKSSAPCKQNGCQCKAGFVYTNGSCTPLCPKPCSTNEICSACPDVCAYDDTCGKLLSGIVPACPVPPVNWKCSPKCMCKPGLVRENGTCSEPSVCCSDANAEFVKCPNPCPGGTCNQPDFAPCNMACKQYGCQCKQGFVKDKDGKCIPLSQCLVKCPANQILDPCPLPCPPEYTCDTFLSGIAYSCPAPPDDDQRVCQPACKCKPGLIRRNKGGDCIDPNDCCDDPNAEVVSCPNPCPGGTCASPDFAPCKAPCKIKGCQCKKGYVKDNNGKCIPLSSCSKSCGMNEVWIQCPIYCTLDDTCSGYLTGRRPVCGPPPPGWKCTGRCYCDKGFLRLNGKCVKPESCCTDPKTELVKCPNPCPGGTCIQPSYTPCKALCQPYGCQCKNGFLKDLNGTCVPNSQCPNKCGPNEVWNPCVPYCTSDMTCERLIDGEIPDCEPKPDNWKCSGACQCSEGYVRIDGNCVEKSECCSNPNTELVSCPNPCPGGTCAQRSRLACNETCKEWGCQCKKGHLLNYKSECIPVAICPVCGENEHFECGPLHDRNCTNPELEADPYGECVERCYCNEGYVRNSKDTCIPIDFCNRPPCGQNERWVPCQHYCAYNRTCSILFNIFEIFCPPTPPPFWKCSGACECIQTSNGIPYVRINGTCQHPNTCCSELNTELVKCPNRCGGGTCQQPMFSSCSTGCPPHKCQCTSGFVRDANKTCIPLDKCPNLSTVTTIKNTAKP